MITCMECGDRYIGETARPLCLRINEHLKEKTQSRVSTPLGAHRIQKHSGGDFTVQVSILAHETEIVARKTLEALWIRARAPVMNRRDECLPVTSELAPYLGLCHF